MDASLLKEREKFLKRKAANLSVSSATSKKKVLNHGQSSSAKKSNTILKAGKSVDWKSSSGSSSQPKFATLNKIVNFLKCRFQEGKNDPLNLEEILEDAAISSVPISHQQWLVGEALPNNPKILIAMEGGEKKFYYKPKFKKLRSETDLLRQLQIYQAKGMGGLLMEDVEDSLPQAAKLVNSPRLQQYVIVVTRPNDKKQVLFFNDRKVSTEIDDRLCKLWNSVSVDEIGEDNILGYLDKHSISSMRDAVFNKSKEGGTGVGKRQKGGTKKPKRRPDFKMMNEHVKDILQDFSKS